MRVLVLGAAGMLGHRLAESLSQTFETTATFRAEGGPLLKLPIYSRCQRLLTGVDVRRLETVSQALEEFGPEVVVNCVGLVKQLEAARDPARSIEVNALFPHRLAELCAESRARLIHISTDCVFSGRRGAYTESDEADPVDLYGRTKLLGEVGGPGRLTLRTSMIGRELRGQTGLLEWFLAQRGHTVSGYTAASFSGLTTLALARVIGSVIADHRELEGLYHVAGEAITKHELLSRIRDHLELEVEIEASSTPRCDRSLIGERFVQSTGLSIPSWQEMIAELAAECPRYEPWRS
jgi:dTDP-4-dehydrorhamnose reductase